MEVGAFLCNCKESSQVAESSFHGSLVTQKERDAFGLECLKELTGLGGSGFKRSESAAPRRTRGRPFEKPGSSELARNWQR
jgi:hypothetical protein